MASRNRATGGSAATRLTRNRQPAIDASEKNRRALERAVGKLGTDQAANIRANFDNLDKRLTHTDWGIGNGIISSLLGLKLSQNEIRVFLGVGSSRIQRVEKNRLNENRELQERAQPSHACTEEDLELVRFTSSTWELEDGFPCAHRRPRQYFIAPGVTWSSLWKQYRDKMEELEKRVLSQSRWTQYIKKYFPGLRLSKSKEDVCDACIRIDNLLLRNDLTEAERAALTLEKEMHMEAAVNQRRAMTAFVKHFIQVHDPYQVIPEHIVQDFIEDEAVNVVRQRVKVQVQAEDFGGSLTMPHYGYSRPSADYFNSNLIIQNFIIADITSGENNILFYDERAQGKDANALCSLRLIHHLNKMKDEAEISFSILDNCVGQNKSNVVMKFAAMMSLLFYKKVALLFLIPGHSHMIADRVVAWMKNKIRGLNLYHPEDFVSHSNTIHSVKSVFLDHQSPSRPFFIGWDKLLDK